jgi:uncharacterized protein YjbI with pentapeptide repeats
MADLSNAWLEGANLSSADLTLANLSGSNLNWTNLTGACLEGAKNFTQKDFFGKPMLSNCAKISQECSYEDSDNDGFDDNSFWSGYYIGAISGDTNLDKQLNILDIIESVNKILHP